MRTLFHEILLLNLEQKYHSDHHLYRTREDAYMELKHYTGQDFGYDVVAWRQWFKESEDPLPNYHKPFDKKDEIN